MKLCNGCQYLNKTYEFSQNGLVCHYNYECITPFKGLMTIQKQTRDKDVWKPKWCPLSLNEIADALRELRMSPEEYREGLRKLEQNDKRTRRRICLRP